METVDTKQLDEQIQDLEDNIELMYRKIITTEHKISVCKSRIEKLKERKKSIELYNKK